MANQEWYKLRIRPGFKRVVIRRLRRQGIEIFVPERIPADSDKAHRHQSSDPDYIYCRFAQKDRQAVTAVPGVLDIIGRIANPLN